MHEYRTPDERAETDAHNDRVRAVLNQAVRDGASLRIAIRLREPQEVVDYWIDRLWDGLRDNLSDDHPAAMQRMEDRLSAIVLLLTDQIDEVADAALGELRDVTE